jgi:hypothetical protein
MTQSLATKSPLVHLYHLVNRPHHPLVDRTDILLPLAPSRSVQLAPLLLLKPKILKLQHPAVLAAGADRASVNAVWTLGIG